MFCLMKPVLVHGVLRKSGQGCPPCVLQDDKVRKAAKAARGTVKATVSKGDSQSSDLGIVLCCNQKLFQMVSSK